MIPIYNAKPEQVEKALKHVYHASMNKLKGKELELLLAILPDNNGSLYGMTLLNSSCLKLEILVLNLRFELELILHFQVI